MYTRKKITTSFLKKYKKITEISRKNKALRQRKTYTKKYDKNVKDLSNLNYKIFKHEIIEFNISEGGG